MCRTDQYPPPLVSWRYFEQYNRQLLEEFKWGWKSITLPGLKFKKKKKWVLGGQLALLLILVLLIFRFRSRIDQNYPNHYFTRRPISTGVFVSITMLAPYYKSGDPVLDLLLVAVIGFSGARLAPGFATRKWGAKIFYVIAILAVMSILLPLIGVPLPIIRLSVFIGAVLVLILTAWLFKSVFKTDKSKVYLGCIGFSAFMMGVVLFLEIIGESARSSHLFSALIESFFAVLVAWMMMVMAQGVVELVMRSHMVQRIEYLRNKTSAMIVPVVLVIRLVIGFVMASYILETWSVAESAPAAMQKIFALGISIGTFQLTVGLCVSVAACFWGSIVFSHTIQALLSETTFKKNQLQLG
ncbi:MAG: hypothetical protein JRD49_16005, partial [Deltaproteobacteria bacterium]|nr:hypothetical protein [Deltaproteobacteria bacterium]